MSEFKIEVGGVYVTNGGNRVEIIRRVKSKEQGGYEYLGVITYKNGAEDVDLFTEDGMSNSADIKNICKWLRIGFEYECTSGSSYIAIGDASKFDKDMEYPVMVADKYFGKVYFVDRSGKNEKNGISLIPSSGRRKYDDRLSF